MQCVAFPDWTEWRFRPTGAAGARSTGRMWGREAWTGSGLRDVIGDDRRDPEGEGFEDFDDGGGAEHARLGIDRA